MGLNNFSGNHITFFLPFRAYLYFSYGRGLFFMFFSFLIFLFFFLFFRQFVSFESYIFLLLSLFLHFTWDYKFAIMLFISDVYFLWFNFRGRECQREKENVRGRECQRERVRGSNCALVFESKKRPRSSMVSDMLGCNHTFL